MYPVDCTGIVLYPFARFGIVLHDLPGTDFPVDVDLPKNNLLIFCRSKGIVFHGFLNFSFREKITEKAHEVGIIGC